MDQTKNHEKQTDTENNNSCVKNVFCCQACLPVISGYTWRICWRIFYPTFIAEMYRFRYKKARDDDYHKTKFATHYRFTQLW